MNPENTPSTTVPAIDPQPAPPAWHRPRSLRKRFSSAVQLLFAKPTFWQNLPRKSILNAPGNKYQPAKLGDNFKPGALSNAKIVQKFFDRGGKGFARLSTGTVIATNETRESVLA